MNVLVIVVPATLLLAGFFLFLFIWATRRGQFDDLTTPAHKILNDDIKPNPKDTTNE